jgi:hypothetical protein
MDWFKSWHGAPLDDKLIVIAKRCETLVYVTSGFMWALLDHASQNMERGRVSDFDFETYCAKSGMDETLARKIYSALETYPTGKEIIKNGLLTNWEKRQNQSSKNSTERVRRFREKQRNEMERDETPMKRSETRFETRPDLDLEKNKKETPLPPKLSTASKAEKGSFQDLGSLVGSGRVGSPGGSGFDVRTKFSEKDWDEVTLAMRDYLHPGWDRKIVFEKYNSHFANDPPKNPMVAFKAWMKKNQNWLGRAP